MIQSALIDTLTDGVQDDSIARKLIRNQPRNFAQAQALACEEQQAHRAFSIRRREEPMEVDTVGRDTEIKEIRDQLSGLSRKFDEVLAVSRSVPQHRDTQMTRPALQHKWTEDGRPICSYCKKVGHVQAKCITRKRQQGRQFTKPSGNGTNSVPVGPRN